MNRDFAYERLAALMKDLIQTYFPRKDAEGIYPKIRILAKTYLKRGVLTYRLR